MKKSSRLVMALAVAIASLGAATSQAYGVATPTPTVGAVSDGQYIHGKVVHVGGVEVPVGDHIVNSSQLNAFLNGSTPKLVIVDTSTGKIVSAMKARNPAITPAIVNRSNCYAGDSCLLYRQ